MTSEFTTQYGPWALIAGASVGLGAEFADQLAARKLNLILVARRAEVLDELAVRLRARDGIEVRTVALDLASPRLLEELRAATAGLEVGLLVYNAAASAMGMFVDKPLDDLLGVLDINCRGPLILSHEFGRQMAERKRGGILLMTSLAASQGSAYIATYAATKAFNLVLAEGLWSELRRVGVDVLACRAGATRTPAYLASKPKSDFLLMEPGPVVTEALDSLGRTPTMVPGFMNRLSAFFLNRVLTRRAAVNLIGSATEKMYRV